MNRIPKNLKLILFFLLVNSFCAAVESKQMNLVWQIDRINLGWEEDWLMEILSGLNIGVMDDGKFEKFIDNSIIVISANHDTDKYEPYFSELHKRNYKFGIILLSDEFYRISTDFYKYAQFILKNHWHKIFTKFENVIVFPLGYKRGFWRDREKKFELYPRKYVWSFAGQVTQKPTRKEMILELSKVPNFYIHETFDWGDRDSKALNVAEYRNLLLDTIFAPCPAGWWNLDTFRVYEALECGCIPIVENKPLDYFGKFLGQHPFLVVSSWEEAPKLMKELLDNPNVLNVRQIQCHEWWQNYKRNMNEKIVNMAKTKLTN